MERFLFGNLNGKEIYRYVLKGNGVQVAVLDFGATVQSIIVDGTDVALGFPKGEDYAVRKGYVGANVGRVANRIQDGKFTLNGKTYFLTKNEGNNQLHGGVNGFHLKFYDCEQVENGVKMTCFSPDGEEGFPGNLRESVTYLLKDRTFEIIFEATSDKDTVWAPTSHIYFNMNGEVGDATSNILTINADGYTPTRQDLIPTGEIAPVKGTPYDFTKAMVIEDGVKKTGGYDVNFVLNGEYAASIKGDKTGLEMQVYTDMPCLQIYSGMGDMGGVQGKSKLYYAKEGIAIEPQFAPNAINMQGFKKPLLKRGQTQQYYIKLKF